MPRRLPSALRFAVVSDADYGAVQAVQMARQMAILVPRGASIIPVPGRLDVGVALAKECEGMVYDVLERTPGNNSFQLKTPSSPPPPPVPQVVVDTVFDTGATYEAVRRLMPACLFVVYSLVRTPPSSLPPSPMTQVQSDKDIQALIRRTQREVERKKATERKPIYDRTLLVRSPEGENQDDAERIFAMAKKREF